MGAIRDGKIVVVCVNKDNVVKCKSAAKSSLGDNYLVSKLHTQKSTIRVYGVINKYDKDAIVESIYWQNTTVSNKNSHVIDLSLIKVEI